MKNYKLYCLLFITMIGGSAFGQQLPYIPPNAQIGAVINWQQEINFIENKTPWVFWLSRPEENIAPSDKIILNTNQLEIESNLWEKQDFILPQQ